MRLNLLACVALAYVIAATSVTLAAGRMPSVSAMVSYRASSGAFKNLDDVKKVPGLDSARIEAAKERITFAGD